MKHGARTKHMWYNYYDNEMNSITKQLLPKNSGITDADKWLCDTKYFALNY